MTSPAFFHRSRFILGAACVAALFTAGCSKQAAKETAAPAEKAPAAATPASATAAAPASPVGSLDQKISYSIGYDIGKSIAQEGVLTVDIESLKLGLKDAQASEKSKVAPAEMQAAMMELQQKLAAVNAAKGEKQKAVATEFLAKNKLRPEVKETASGLQYEVLTSGTGAKPKPTDTVEVHYHGTLLDGTVFDSSVQRGQTIEFPVTGVIKGWIEALQLMSVGDKWKLYIPPDLGYGARGTGNIPPNALLVFEVQLIAIK